MGGTESNLCVHVSHLTSTVYCEMTAQEGDSEVVDAIARGKLPELKERKQVLVP